MPAPAFFVPQFPAQHWEHVYQDLANLCHGQAVDIEHRIYEITFKHDREEWTATVGQTLRGTATQVRRIRGKKQEQTLHLSDAATVLAIFAGIPFKVMTNNHHTLWSNPFYTDAVVSVTYFGDEPMAYRKWR